MVPLTKFREISKGVLADLRSYYLFAALVVFYLISARAGQMRVLGILGHVFVLALLVGAIFLENKKRALAKELERCRAETGELKAKTAELEAVLLTLRVQKETERLLPYVEEIQRRLLAEFPQYATSFAVAENNGYVYSDELVLTAKTQDGKDLPPEEYTKVLSLARECAKPLCPDLAIHWA